MKTFHRQAEDIIREVGVIGDAMEDSAFNSMMSINHIGSKSIAEIRQQSIHSFVQLRLVFIQNFQIFKSFDLSNSMIHQQVLIHRKIGSSKKINNHENRTSSKSDSQSAEGNIKCIGQFKSGASPPDDKPEYGYGQRVVQIRRFIHEQTRSRQPNRLLDWWQLVKGGFQKLKL